MANIDYTNYPFPKDQKRPCVMKQSELLQSL